jgi:hypothetical protein
MRRWGQRRLGGEYYCYYLIHWFLESIPDLLVCLSTFLKKFVINLSSKPLTFHSFISHGYLTYSTHILSIINTEFEMASKLRVLHG